MKNIYEAQSANKLKSLIIVVGFFLFVSVAVYVMASAFSIYAGYDAGGVGIFGMAMIISGLTSFISYYYSDRIVLGISGAREADRNRDFDFYTATENLSIAAGLPKPKLYVIEDSAMNAFATGRNPEHAVVAATRGLLEKLNRTELEGVIAHELSHIKNYDIRLMSIVAVMVGSVALLADMFFRMRFFGSEKRQSEGGNVMIVLGILFAILSPIIATLIKLAISRRREFFADASAVKITRQPAGLISALSKIASDHEPLEVANKATAHMYIENPFKDKAKQGVSWFSSLFNTHPPVEERIKQLQTMT